MNRDVGVTELIRSALPEWSVPVFEFTALLGDEFVVVAILVGLVSVDVYRSLERDSDRLFSRRVGFVVAVVLGGLALTLVLKTSLGVSRPPSSLQAVSRESGGFPSGHTMAATVLWLALALWMRRSTIRRRMLLASCLIGLVAFSRLALGVHYLVDVVASVGFGAGYLFVVATVTHHDPAKAFAGAALLGTLALAVTGTMDGWLAFAGCVLGGVGWWVLTRPAVRELWAGATR